jgi:glycosyltransferase involved in cell wall biosynthesis
MFWTPERQAASAWTEHVPFAFWLVDVLRPATIVELGTHAGVSYSAMCQGVKTLGLPTKCYAVDTWKGDAHAGFYSEEVYRDLVGFHDPRFGAFSRLVRSTFDEALPHFEDGSIDLLHIDGLHTYEAVRHDFFSWLPKLTPNAVVILHDTNVRERGFGVMRLWQEISDGRRHFAFLHGHGLGVLGLGGEPPPPLAFLFGATHDGALTNRIRDIFAHLGQSAAFLTERAELDALRGERTLLLGQVTRLRDEEIVGLNRRVAARDGLVAGLERALGERDGQIAALIRTGAEGHGRLEALTREVGERDNRIASLDRTLGERNGRIEALSRTVGERDNRIASLDRTLGERDGRIEALSRTVGARDGRIAGLNRSVEERDAHIVSLNLAVVDRDAQIAALHKSTSWRLTAPLRLIRRMPRGAAAKIRPLLSQAARSLYHRAPLQPAVKLRIKHTLFGWLGSFFRHTKAFQDWQSWQRDQQAPPQVAQSVQQHSDYVPPYEGAPPSNPPVRLIAFYLPQFHPIPENDAFWGKGFTEWTNVARASQQFEGHYQPRLPGELGFYDLRVPEVQKRQIQLAKQYGLYGFCFHFYWFGGKRLLEMPLQQFASDTDNDFRFCINWANENWTRRWDGQEHELLIAQQHSPEDDLAFIEHVSRYLRDKRYIRVDGKPLLLVYRPGLLPSAKDTASRWRRWCRDNGVGEIYLAYTQSFDAVDPAAYGFDAAIEFPPNLGQHPKVNHQVTPLRDDFECNIFDWKAHVEQSRHYKQPVFTLFRGICPSWDNTARRRNRAGVLINSSPEGYVEWFSNAIVDTCRRFAKPDQRLIFVNAWNEWAEGAYLEPDARYGYAYLRATRDALNHAGRTAQSIVVVTHDCRPHGAQFLALNLAKTFTEKFGLHVELVTLGEGPLKPEFAKIANCHDLADVGPAGDEALALAQRLRADGHVAAICNTTVTGSFVPTLKAAGLRCVSLIHELPGIIRQYGLLDAARTLAMEADRVIFPADVVANGFEQVATLPPEKRIIRPQGLYKRNRLRRKHKISAARAELRRRLGLPIESLVVLAVGYADQRKGVDLFVEAGFRVLNARRDTAMVWLGDQEPGVMPHVRSRIAQESMADRFFFEGLDVETDIYYAGADVYAMSSREDPFPSVVLEALDAGLPVVAFADVGGFCDLVVEARGAVVPAFDTAAFGDALLRLLDDQGRRDTSAELGRSLIASRFSFRKYAHDLLSLSGVGPLRVSVVVPNYNYAHLLSERMKSIAAQTHPLYEIILLDDASTDDSLIAAKSLMEALEVPNRIIANERNSGSVFRQWLRGVEAATGDYVWIAEADDSSTPEFLAEVMPAFADPHVVMSYCESKQMAPDGRILCDNYFEYVSDISPHKWRTAYVAEGAKEICDAFAVKNTIPNVSAVVFRRDVLLNVLGDHLEEISRFKIAGDWYTYTLLLERGKIAFSSRALNLHRRHEVSVTLSSNHTRHLAEIVAMQDIVRRRVPAAAVAREQACKYAQTLYDRFGLATPSCPHYSNHPALEALAAPGARQGD